MMSEKATLAAGNRVGSGRQGNWEMVGTCPTMESARQTLDELRAAGVDAAITMIDGLCVIARVDQPQPQLQLTA